MELDDILKRLNDLHDEGEKVKLTAFKKQYRHVVSTNPPTVNMGKFVKWQSKTIIFLEKIVDADDFRLISFKGNVR